VATLRLAEIAAATKGELAPGGGAAGGTKSGGAAAHGAALGDRRVDGYSIDTRSLRKGDLFVAIVGPRVDGHDFVGEAVRRGASAVVVARGGPQTWKDAPAIVKVKDSTRALQDLGAHVRRRRPLRVIGITGSAGKTTAKEMTAAVLGTRFRTHRSEGNLNNTYGLPLTLLRMADDCEASVLEMGMSYKGEIARLVEIADPDVGVILNVLRVHLEHFPSLDGIARAKGEMFAGLRRDAAAVYNADDPRVARLGRAFRGTTLSYGMVAKGCDVTARGVEPEGLGGVRFTLEHGREKTSVRLAIAGRHHVYNALAAAACGYACGIASDAIAAGLAAVKPAPMRGVLHRRADGTEILDDSYNSNPTAMERVIDLLQAAEPRGRRVLVAGDMLELGPYASRAHARIGALASKAGLDLFVAVGPLSEKAAEAARRPAGRGGKSPARGQGRGSPRGGGPEVRHFDTSDEAGAWLKDAVRPGDLVLVKGSRGMKMERVVQALLGTEGGAH
jgi:UDP-N-acetylmuramoyl-tripeptide--D-alanyl-D-alanine ligase